MSEARDSVDVAAITIARLRQQPACWNGFSAPSKYRINGGENGISVGQNTFPVREVCHAQRHGKNPRNDPRESDVFGLSSVQNQTRHSLHSAQGRY